MSLKTLLPLLLLLAVLGRSRAGGVSMPGAPYNISTDDGSLQKVALSAASSFNDRSNDAFLFKPSAIRRAQTQVVKGIRYIVDFDISRTVCRKRSNKQTDLNKCDFQPAGRLRQTFQCHFEMWTVPWTNERTIQGFTCKP